MPQTQRLPYRQGLIDSLPFILVIVPFGLLFGVVASEAGLNMFETVAFSVVVIAGAAQFTAIQLMTEHVPTMIIVASALAVNLRMAMYSAALTPHLGPAPLGIRAIIAYFTVDQTYTCAIGAYEQNPDWDWPKKAAYFFGSATAICPLWFIATAVGAYIGSGIPPEFALDFALPITFLAMIAPALRSAPHRAAAFTSVVLALALNGLPHNLGLLVAAVIAMMVGAQFELWQSRRAQKAEV